MYEQGWLGWEEKGSVEGSWAIQRASRIWEVLELSSHFWKLLLDSKLIIYMPFGLGTSWSLGWRVLESKI